jgi:hypothetical protein
MLAGPVDAADRQKPDHDRRPEKMTDLFQHDRLRGTGISIPCNEAAVIRHFQQRMAERLSVRDVHAEVAVAATEATKIRSLQRAEILISPVGFAETVLHSPSLLASVPGSISAGPIVPGFATAPVSVGAGIIIAAMVRARRRGPVARTRRRSVARTRRRRSVARSWLNINIVLSGCHAGCAGENHSYEPRYQHLLQ